MQLNCFLCAIFDFELSKVTLQKKASRIKIDEASRIPGHPLFITCFATCTNYDSTSVEYEGCVRRDRISGSAGCCLGIMGLLLSLLVRKL